MDHSDDFFEAIEKKTNVNRNDIFDIAGSLKNVDFTDENTIRRLIGQVSGLAGVPVSKEKEERIVEAIVNNEVPFDFSTLAKMFN